MATEGKSPDTNSGYQMNKEKRTMLSELKKKLCTYLSANEIVLVEKAFQKADDAHKDQFRKSKEPYITHPLKVALILANLEMDSASICAGLLHDVIEDCGITKNDLTQEFGEDVAILVEGVTKLGTLAFKSSEEAQAENFRKMFLAMAQDIRVVVIKLADRLHNMQTLKYHSREKQIEIARETRDIFCPLAHRLGMGKLKWELEDLAFYFLEPDQFQAIKKLVAEKREEREEYIENFCADLGKLLEKHNMKATIMGRPKHFFSIHNKLKNSGLSIDSMYDALGVRVLMSSIQECYEVLGVVHSAYNPVSGRFKDYIAMPKSNLYQSLHTTVIGPKGKPVEIQIRTHQMHQIAEYGIAAHWQYKEGKSSSKFDGDLSWLREIIEHQKENLAPKDYLQNIKVDLFVDEVFVFSPKGDVHILVKGSTPLDFAYRIHSEIGNTTVGAKVNGKIVPLTHTLRSGDQVEMMTSKKSVPKVDWLNIVKSSHAKSKIKQWLKRQNRIEQVEKGREKLEKAIILSGYPLKKAFSNASEAQLVKCLKVHNMDEIYIMISQGELSPNDVVECLEPLEKTDLHHHANPKAEAPEFIPEKEEPTPGKKVKTNTIRVLGEENVDTNLAQCCAPVFGDRITGFVTLGQGVSIHKSSCSNVKHFQEKYPERLIKVEWNTLTSLQTYPARLEIEAYDRQGVFSDILVRIADAKINVMEALLNTSDNKAFIDITINVHNLEELNQLKTHLANLTDVYVVKRSELKS